METRRSLVCERVGMLEFFYRERGSERAYGSKTRILDSDHDIFELGL